MISDDKFALVLLVQNAYRIFCYFSISPLMIKEFEDKNGENSWKNSKPILKVFEINNGSANEIQTIFLDAVADNWFINLDKTGIDVFVKLGRVLPDDIFIPISVSNTVTTPRANQSNDLGVYYVDISEGQDSNKNEKLPTTSDVKKSGNIHKEPKPYPFMEQKKTSYIQK